MKKKSFGPFQGEKSSKKKERIRQEKKAVRRETKEYFEKKKEEERKARRGYGANFDSRTARPAPASPDQKPTDKKTIRKAGDKPAKPTGVKTASPTHASSGPMPLNKFVAHSGICSRRDAAELVKSGKVTVNGETILEPGFKVNGTEDIKVNGKRSAPARRWCISCSTNPRILLLPWKIRRVERPFSIS